jgi:DNA-directed RNA polymerase subunit N (RpoN/RPB10)
MIIETNTIIKIHPSNYKWFNEKGYGPFKGGDLIEILISDLMPSSKHIIKCKCTNCGNIIGVKYQNYKVQIKRGGYYICVDCSQKKSQKTNIEKYGSISPLGNKDIQKKGRDTIWSKYGVDNPSKVETIKEKKRVTTNKNYGVDNPMQNISIYEKAKQTWMIKYGVNNPSKSDIIKEKKRKTTNKNYGVDNPTQSSEIFEKQQKTQKTIKLHDNGLYYRGSYEKDFLDHCNENNIEIEKGFTIKYLFNGKNKYYHSDFYLPKYNLICEIKSDYYYYKYYEKNIMKRKYTIKNGYNFLFIINKKYFQLNNIIYSSDFFSSEFTL